MKLNKILLIILGLVIILLFFCIIYKKASSPTIIDNVNNNTTSTDKNVDGGQNQTVAVIDDIVSGQIVKSPLVITGKARGNWFFEASFPIKLLDSNKKEIAITVAQAKSDWMTTDFVEFEAILEFQKPNSQYGYIVFKKDNPSGMPELDEEITKMIKF